MQIVIEMPEEVVKNGDYVSYFGVVSEKLIETIKNGIPLPKGHGRLIDADTLKVEMAKASNLNMTVGETIDFAPTIIEKDKEQEDD